jgi:hypothetical protein
LLMGEQDGHHAAVEVYVFNELGFLVTADKVTSLVQDADRFVQIEDRAFVQFQVAKHLDCVEGVSQGMEPSASLILSIMAAVSASVIMMEIRFSIG